MNQNAEGQSCQYEEYHQQWMIYHFRKKTPTRPNNGALKTTIG